MKGIYLTIAGVVCTLLCSCAGSVEQAIDRECSALFDDGGPGAAVLVMQGDKVLFDKGYGLSRLDRTTDNKTNGETLFNIASCSKQFTAVAVLQLTEAGKVRLDAPVSEYFPELNADIWDSVEIRHLLSHSSGVPDARGYLSREERVLGDETTATEYLKTLETLHFPPGSDYEYINPTYVLLGQLVERVSGMPFTEYMEQNVLRPAGMQRSRYFEPGIEDMYENTAHGYEYGDLSGEGEEHHSKGQFTNYDLRFREGHDWYEYDYGEETFFGTRPDGGLYSSTHEIAMWEKALRKMNLQEAWSPHTKVSGSQWSDYQNREGTWYGYGWFIEPEKGCVYHTGDNGGFKALICRYPEKETLVVILANRTDWDRYALKSRIEELLFQDLREGE